jgi:hypothetical protein
MQVKIADILLDEKIYPRSRTNWMTAFRYSQAMKAGNKFPPIKLGKFKGKLYLVDGWHRLIAVRDNLHQEFIEAVVDDFRTKREMYLAAIEANVTHGQKLSTFEVRIIGHELMRMKIPDTKISTLLGIPIVKFEDFFSFQGFKAPIRMLLEQQKVNETDAPELTSHIDQTILNVQSVQHSLRQSIELLKSGLVPLDDPAIRELCAELYSVLSEALKVVAS